MIDGSAAPTSRRLDSQTDAGVESPDGSSRHLLEPDRRVAPEVVGVAPVAQLAALARDLGAAPDEAGLLTRAAELAVGLVDGCSEAGLMLVRRRRVEPGPAASTLAAESDALQARLGEGPALDCLTQRAFVISDDLLHESRWRSWTPHVSRLGRIRSVAAVELSTASTTLGALILYSPQPHAFSGEPARAVAEALAAHVAVAVAAAREIESRGVAITARTTIGQAQGILMERYALTPDLAFSMLKRVSSTTNTKLAAVAGRLVSTRETPRPAAGARP